MFNENLIDECKAKPEQETDCNGFPRCLWSGAKLNEGLAMFRAYYSSVLNQPTNQIWDLVRDFNNYPSYIDGVTESIIENDKRGDEIGAVRRFCWGGSWVRQCLIAHSDAIRSFSYSGLEPFQFPTQAAIEVPAAVEYAGTLKVTPITDGDRTFIEWYVDFNCSPNEVERWNDLLMSLIPQWVGSLRRTLDSR